jgi:hypothetical protein
MDLVATAHLVDNFDQIVRRAINDDLKSASSDNPSSESVLAYLDTIDKALLKFTATGGVVGRRREYDDMMDLLRDKGTLALVSGGASVGITKLLNKVIKDIKTGDGTLGTQEKNHRVRGKRPARIVHFDGRAASWPVEPQQESAVPISFGGLQLSLPVPGPVSQLMTFDMAAITDCVTKLWLNPPEKGEHVVLVLDEAGRFLESTNKAAAETKELFRKLVMYTKPTTHLSVILLSSDETLVSRLNDLDLRTSALQSLVIGGASPAEMLAQLQELGVGRHLRELLVSVYGGHLGQISVALSHLKKSIQRDSTVSVWREPLGSIRDAVKLWEQAGGDRKRLVSVLEEVARCGFYPIFCDGKLERALTQAGVCAYLTDGAEEYFIDPAVRKGRSGLAASTQLVRVLIPVVLKQLGEVPSGSGK